MAHPAFGNDVDPYTSARQKMVHVQIVERGVSDPKVLGVMKVVPRHLFVSPESRKYAYEDYPLSIGYDQTISQPYIVAFMTEAAGLKSGDKVLEIGTGSGYQAAVLAELVREVYTIEIVKPLADSARERLAALGYQNIFVKHGDGFEGWEEHGPFDAIIVTAAPLDVPPRLLQQLKVGGRMVIPVGGSYQELVLITKRPEGIEKKTLIPVRFVPMIPGKTMEKDDKD